ncbi:MAG: anhydro-N-acetylmuramic acid kinase [Halocynthiibacter sp.]|jgi:anhydro-N-acetylmuramic acid kinase
MLGKGAVWALGAMSGTSLDGVDAALIRTNGEVIEGFGESGYRPYSDAERAALRAELGAWEASSDLCEMIETAHAELLAQFPDGEIIGFHGQTLAHDPEDRGTYQAGDGAVLAEVLGRPVVWDFRSADVKLGGQGAPLAPFYHFALAQYIGAEAPIAFLNLGGVGNITWVDPSAKSPAAEGALLAFDTGPANAPINDAMRARRDLDFDEGGALAATGRVDEAILERFLQRSYFLKIPPKSLDRNDFASLLDNVAELGDADAIATLTACVAASVVQGMQFCPAPPSKVLVCGGGRHNTTLMQMLAAGLDCPVEPVEAEGLDGDMLEAQAFAHLAVRVARGLPTSCPGTTGVRAAVSGGQLSTPSAG